MMRHKDGKNRIAGIAVYLILFVFVLSACGDVAVTHTFDPEPMPGQVKVYCMNSSSDGLQWENYDLRENDLEKRIEQVIGFLLRTPRNSLYKRVIPQEISILSHDFGTDGQLIVDFSSDYLKLGKIQEVLCRAGIVKTLCQIDGVDYVEFYVDGVPLKLQELPVGLMTGSDFIDNTESKSDLNQSVKLTLYMTDDKGKMLQETIASVTIDGTKTLEEVAIESLIKGVNCNSTILPTVNSNTKINRIRTFDGICYVDFSEDFLTRQGKISDDVAVYSVVNTLCEITSITKVRISVDGSKKNYGKISLNEYLSLRPELIAQEQGG